MDMISSSKEVTDFVSSSAAAATNTFLTTSSHHHEAATTTTTSALFSSLLPVLGSSLIMLTIVGLLYIWEESVEWVRETVPKALLPVVESVLAEISGLGFIGLILQTILGNAAAKEGLEEISIQFFGEGDILVENFEFLHTAFFQVGVGFFLAAGVMVAVGLSKLAEIETVQGLQFDQENCACSVTAEKLSEYVPTETDDSFEKPGQVGLFQEVTMAKEKRAGLSLLMRHQLMKMFPHLPDSFRIETYIQASFAQTLLKMVELSPLTWLYLIPALALANAIDLSHEVVNASSPNAAESVGFFFSTPAAIVPASVSVLLAAVWGTWNCWKMTQIKYMLIPRVGREDTATGEKIILPPYVESEATRTTFMLESSSPGWVQPIERIWANQPAKNPFEELFGTAGGSGLKLYRSSIKYQSWLCLTHIVFFGTQIIPRDIDALLGGTTTTTTTLVGNPSFLTAELITYGGFVLVSLLQLIFISPRAFWNYCLVACLEEENAKKLLLQVSGNSGGPSTTMLIPTSNQTLSQR